MDKIVVDWKKKQATYQKIRGVNEGSKLHIFDTTMMSLLLISYITTFIFAFRLEDICGATTFIFAFRSKDIRGPTTFIFAFRASASLRVFVTRLWTERSNFRQMKMYYPPKRKSHKLRNVSWEMRNENENVLSEEKKKWKCIIRQK